MATTTTTDPRAPLVPLPVAEALARVYTYPPANGSAGWFRGRGPHGYESKELGQLNCAVNGLGPWRPAAWHRPLTGPGGWWPDEPGGGEAA